jgi:hypothetical protein
MADGQLSLIKASPGINAKGEEIVSIAKRFFAELDVLEVGARIATLNALRLELAKHSPFASEPVDCIQWIHTEEITANDYNPNSVAPPEMTLLEHSVASDGFTQPIVAWKNGAEYEYPWLPPADHYQSRARRQGRPDRINDPPQPSTRQAPSSSDV